MAASRSRNVALAVVLLAGLAGLAAAARWMLAERYPLQQGEWWRPAESPPVLDPATLARAAQQRKAFDRELAERRARVRPIPPGLAGAAAVLQLGHVAPIGVLAWYGTDLLTAARDGTVRLWRPAEHGPQLLQSLTLPDGVPRFLAADPAGGRLWFVLDDDLLVVRDGDAFADEHRRFLDRVTRVLGLAVAEHGLRAVLLDVPASAAGDAPPLELRLLLGSDAALLKSVPLRPAAPLLAAALSTDGTRVALLLAAPAGPALELRSTDDGTVLVRAALALPAGVVADAETSLALGSDFVALATRGGTAVFELAADGTPASAPVASWPAAPDAAAPPAIRAACDGGAVIVEPSGWWLARRGSSGWERSNGEAGAPDAAICATDGSVAWSEGAALEVRGPAGAGRVPPWPALGGVAFDDAAQRIDVLPAPSGDAPAAVASLDLQEFRLERRELGGTGGVIDQRPAMAPDSGIRTAGFSPRPGSPAAPRPEGRGSVLAGQRPVVIDPVGGAVATVRDGALWRETAGGSVALPGAPADGACVALHGDALALRGDGWVEVRSWAGGSSGRWTWPAWLGAAPRVSLARDGRTLVLTGEGGLVVYRVGQVEPILFFPAEGYADAPADVPPLGSRIAIGRNDGTLELWSPASGEVEQSMYAIGPIGGRPTALWAADDGETLYAGSSRGVVGAWRVRTGSQVWIGFPFDGPVATIVPSSRMGAVLASDDRRVTLLGARTGDVLFSFAIDAAGAWMAATPDGYHVGDGADSDALLVLRLRAAPPPAGATAPYRLLTGSDAGVAALGDAVDALRATVLGAVEATGR